MNQARSTYQIDFTPLDWFQNNFSSEIGEFCSSDNIDECLKYISQEFCALGYPSIYRSSSDDCPLAVNCDIVKLLNATFELLRKCNEYVQTKEDIECRNQRLSSDLNILNRKNSQLKISLEQNERKLASSLERERQLKEKNEQLVNLLKSEKDETKRLTAQLRQQKVAFQHDVRKYENNMNHIKAKLNQLLSDKNPNKKIVSMASSHTLPRGTKQRGKWKTTVSSSTLAEDMYNSVISNYETRCKDLYKEMNAHRQCLNSVLSDMFEIISSEQEYVDNFTTSEEFVLSSIKLDSDELQSIEDKFKSLFSILKKISSEKANHKNLEDTVTHLKAKLSEYEDVFEQCGAQKETESIDNLSIKVNHFKPNKVSVDDLQEEKLKLDAERVALSESLQHIEREKVDLAAEKLAVLRFSMQQKMSPSWQQGLSILPSISVITSSDGTTNFPNNPLKISTGSPDQLGQSHSSVWKSYDETVDKQIHSKSHTSLVMGNTANLLPSTSLQTPNLNFSDSDLPSWATNPAQSINVTGSEPATPKTSQDTISDLSSEPSSEEINILRFRAAMQDIEQRRLNVS